MVCLFFYLETSQAHCLEGDSAVDAHPPSPRCAALKVLCDLLCFPLCKCPFITYMSVGYRHHGTSPHGCQQGPKNKDSFLTGPAPQPLSGKCP